MPQKTNLRTLIYKRTHKGDPDKTGCSGKLRNIKFDAVVGIGGTGPQPDEQGISYKVNRIGIGARKTKPNPKIHSGWRGPFVTFDHFVLFEDKGPDFWIIAPVLARHRYSAKPPRFLFDDFNKAEQMEVGRLVKIAKNASASIGTLRAGIFRCRPKCC
jgi:hypothetical protein